MSTLVIDASVAIKWVIEESGTPEALALRRNAKLIAPDLLVPECANILWKKVQRGELSREEAAIAARLLQGADVELLPMGYLLEPAVAIAIALDHPAYDCLYLALAIARECRFVTADARFLRRLGEERRDLYRDRAVSLSDAGRA